MFASRHSDSSCDLTSKMADTMAASQIYKTYKSVPHWINFNRIHCKMLNIQKYMKNTKNSHSFLQKRCNYSLTLQLLSSAYLGSSKPCWVILPPKFPNVRSTILKFFLTPLGKFDHKNVSVCFSDCVYQLRIITALDFWEYLKNATAFWNEIFHRLVLLYCYICIGIKQSKGSKYQRCTFPLKCLPIISVFFAKISCKFYFNIYTYKTEPTIVNIFRVVPTNQTYFGNVNSLTDIIGNYCWKILIG